MKNIVYEIVLTKTLANKFRTELYINRPNDGFQLLLNYWEDYNVYEVVEKALIDYLDLVVLNDNSVENTLDLTSLAVFGKYNLKDLVIQMVRSNNIKTLMTNFSIELLEKMVRNISGMTYENRDIVCYMNSDTNIETFKEEMFEDIVLDAKEESEELGKKVQELLEKYVYVNRTCKDGMYVIKVEYSKNEYLDVILVLFFAWLQGCASDRFEIVSVVKYFTTNLINLSIENLKLKLNNKK